NASGVDRGISRDVAKRNRTHRTQALRYVAITNNRSFALRSWENLAHRVRSLQFLALLSARERIAFGSGRNTRCDGAEWNESRVILKKKSVEQNLDYKGRSGIKAGRAGEISTTFRLARPPASTTKIREIR